LSVVIAWGSKCGSVPVTSTSCFLPSFSSIGANLIFSPQPLHSDIRLQIFHDPTLPLLSHNHPDPLCRHRHRHKGGSAAPSGLSKTLSPVCGEEKALWHFKRSRGGAWVVMSRHSLRPATAVSSMETQSLINANVAGSLLVTNAVMERTLLRGTPRGRASWKLLGTVDGRFPCPVSHCARTYGSKVSHDAGFPHQRMHPSLSHCMGVNRAAATPDHRDPSQCPA